MLKTIPGFPRIGKKRELKFLIESYLKGEKTEEEIVMEGKKIETENFNLMKDKIDLLPVNDFSYYDNMLDTAWMLGAVDTEYIENNLNLFQKYFAIARGYQDKSMDLKAYDMKKWFTTNYHYVVPKLSEKIQWKINFEFIKQRLENAINNKINFKFIIIGPFTFLKLAKVINKGESNFDYLDKILTNYKKLLNYLNQNKIKFLQIDEPAIVFDLNPGEVNIFKEIYEEILKDKFNFKIILQTYFGDIKDIYAEICKLNFDGLGLDFIEGEDNFEVLEKYGFNDNKILVTGIINGKNIWKTDYNKTIDKIKRLKRFVKNENLWLSTTCSLLFVPYIIDSEQNIPEKIKSKISFAIEKINELSEIDKIILNNRIEYISTNKYANDDIDINLRDKILSLTEKDFHREKNFTQRYEIQKKFLKLPLFPTTTIGSFPQTEELRRVRKQYKENKIGEAEYENYIKRQIEDVINIQEKIGLDVLVHGEFERNDMVEYFAEFLTGVITTENGWVQSYGTRTTKPPIIYGDVKRKKPMTIKWIKYAQSLTNKLVKAILTGPVTIINWSFVREDINIKEVAFQIALAIREEIDELQNAGIKIIQVDEAALREKVPLKKNKWKEYFDWAISSFKLATSSIKPEVQLHTHMCYSEFGEIINYIEEMDVDVISIEAAKSEFHILEKINDYSAKRQIGPGVYDIHSPRIPSKEEIKNQILKILNVVPKNNLWINPDCGLKTREFDECIASLENIVQATKEIKKIIK